MKVRAWAALLLIVSTSAAFAPSLTSQMTHYDDPLYVWHNLERISPEGWKGFALQFDSTRAWNGDFVEYFPLRDAVYWVLYQNYGVKALPYHLTSLVLHIIAALLLWLLLEMLSLPWQGAWLAALLFALHPVHIESVVWIAALKDPMFTSFLLGGLCAYQSYRTKPSPWKYTVMLLCLVCGFLVKSIMVAMAPILFAMEVLMPPRAAWKEIAARLAGPFIISALFFANIIGVGKANFIIVPPHGGSWVSHIVLTTWVQAKYLKQVLMPTAYRLIYCFDPVESLADTRFFVGVAALVAVGVLTWLWRREPLRLFFVFFYAATMAPVSNLIPFPAVMADRYLYAPSIGVCALLGMAAVKLHERLFKLVVTVGVVALVGATATRASVWQNEEDLWAEPDDDPACVTDTSFPAAQAHILRYFTTKDRHQMLLSLERAMATPGVKGVTRELGCATIIGATREAQTLDGAERAIPWAKMSTKLCPNESKAWNVAMLVSLHKDPVLAAKAATRAWRLEKNPETESLMWLTLLELHDTRAPRELLRIARLHLRSPCEKIAQFATDVPALVAELAEPNFECESVLKEPDNPPPPSPPSQ